MRTGLSLFCTLSLALVVFAGNVVAADGLTKAEIKERMKNRYPDLARLKEQQKIGETYQGLVESVAKKDGQDGDIARIINEENADRSTLYPLVAGQTGTTAAAVAVINAQRVFQKAGPLEYFKDKDGVWRKKKDIKNGFAMPDSAK